ncbi:MAG: DNA-formamidopyrimidine glycosylase family protein [Spirochaetota bacterium]
MPELPDLIYIVRNLNLVLPGNKIANAYLKEPVVIRMLVHGTFAEILNGRLITSIDRNGPFIRLRLSGYDIICHLMLAGRFQYLPQAGKPGRHSCFSLNLDNGGALHYLDEKRMGKIYVTAGNKDYEKIPGYLEQGIDILKKDFSFELFKNKISGKRCQVRVFLMDQKIMSAIGNAYADEILFEAGLHPKRLCSQLSIKEIEKLYEAIGKVIRWAIEMVEKAKQPIEIKVREHLKVRNRLNAPCPACGTKIRRASVLGYDAFFCPTCQPGGEKVKSLF